MADKSKETTLASGIIQAIIVISVIVLIIILILPSYHSNCGTPFNISCQSNMRQVGMAVMMYAVDYNDTLPCDINYLPKEYMDNRNDNIQCPGNRMDSISGVDYVLCAGGKVNDYAFPEDNLLFWELPYNHQQKLVNCGFADAHIEKADATDFDDFVKRVQDANDLLAKLRNKPEGK